MYRQGIKPKLLELSDQLHRGRYDLVCHQDVAEEIDPEPTAGAARLPATPSRPPRQQRVRRGGAGGSGRHQRVTDQDADGCCPGNKLLLETAYID